METSILIDNLLSQYLGTLSRSFPTPLSPTALAQTLSPRLLLRPSLLLIQLL
jgi:hypothetical protein